MISQKIIDICKEEIRQSDVVLIGAGAGLSTADGLEYSGKRFTDNFADYIEKYKLTDMYSAAFYPHKTMEEKWGYFSRHIKLNRYDAQAGQVYTDLLNLVKDKNHFVLTTNGDALFEKAGFDKKRLFATQGDYAKLQCERGCHPTLYDNEALIERMVAEQRDFKIPSKLIPICPVCAAYLITHLRIDQYFVENEDWHAAKSAYTDFLSTIEEQRLVILELGVGFNTPTIIRFPFEQLAATKQNSCLIRVNIENIQRSHDLQNRGILVQGDIAEFLNFVKNRSLSKATTNR